MLVVPNPPPTLSALRRSMQPRMILGSGRSGTTWVLDCLAEANCLRPVFEPLHPAESALGPRYAHGVMAIGDKDETLERYFLDLAAGRIRSRWLDYRSPGRALFPPPRRLASLPSAKHWIRSWRKHVDNLIVLRSAARREHALIKSIRANLMAGWLARTLGFRTVLIVRHPCAVVESRCRLGWNPAQVLTRYYADRKLHKVTGGRYWDLLNSKLNIEEALTLAWIIENQWPVEQSKRGGYAVVYYEDLILTPENSWRYLCDSLGLSHLPEAAIRGRPSQQASTAFAHRPVDQPLESRWCSNLSTRQLDMVQSMLDVTGCTLYGVEDTVPKHARHTA